MGAKLYFPQTLTKAGVINENLEDITTKFSSEFEEITAGFGNTIKYALYKETPETHLLIISQQKDKIISPEGYNSILTITSNSSGFNLYTYKKFEQKTKVNFKDAPQHLSEMMQNIGLAFPFFEQYGKIVMEVLKMI